MFRLASQWFPGPSWAANQKNLKPDLPEPVPCRPIVRRSLLLRHSKASALPQSLCAQSPTRAIPSPPRSSCRPSRSCSRAATCSPPRRPAPARPQASCCRCCKGSARPAADHRPIRALILVPTRELAAQVQESVRTYGAHQHLRSTVIFGGVGINPQIAELRRGVDILVATPGRLLDHVQQKTVDLSPGRDPGARRSRSHARHGLHPGHPPHPRAAAGETPEPAVLGHLLRTKSASSRPASCTTPRRSKSRAATRRPTWWRRSSTRWMPRASASCWRTWSNRTTGARCWFSRAPSTAPTAWPSSSSKRRHPGRRDPRQQEPERAHARARRLQGRRAPRAGGDRHRRARPRHRQSCRTW